MTVRIARYVCRLLVLFLATALLPSVLSAQSILNFPRVISSDQVFTGLAVGNPTPGAVTVTFTAYGADGSLVTGGGVENPNDEDDRGRWPTGAAVFGVVRECGL